MDLEAGASDSLPLLIEHKLELSCLVLLTGLESMAVPRSIRTLNKLDIRSHNNLDFTQAGLR